MAKVLLENNIEVTDGVMCCIMEENVNKNKKIVDLIIQYRNVQKNLEPAKTIDEQKIAVGNVLTPDARY